MAFSTPIPRLLTVAVLSCLLCGCFGASKPEPAAPSSPSSPVLEFITANVPGASAVLHDPEFGEDIRVTLEEDFTSAGGETCKRATLLSVAQEAEVVVACRSSDGRWQLAPRIWGTGLLPR